MWDFSSTLYQATFFNIFHGVGNVFDLSSSGSGGLGGTTGFYLLLMGVGGGANAVGGGGGDAGALGGIGGDALGGVAGDALGGV